MKKVLYDELVYGDDLLFTHNGDVFTGLAFESFVDGALSTEIPIVDGKEHGIARDYFESGRVKVQTIYVSGVKHGAESEWYESGQVKEENVLHKGYLMNSKKWSETGELIEEYKRSEDDSIYKMVAKSGWK